MFCIPKEKIDEYRKALKSRKIDIRELMSDKMTSEKRTAIFKEFAGDNAKTMNTLFEQKLILKRKAQGIQNFINKTAELGRYNPNKKVELAKLKSEYVAKQQERMFSPKEEEAFLSDLIEEKLGVRISREQAQTAYDIQMKADKLFESFDNSNPDPQKWEWKDETAQAKYGATKQIYKKYIENLKNENLPIKDMVKGYSQEIKELWKESKYKATGKVMGDSIYGLSKTMINAVASWDNSFLGRQGAITLIKSPKTWWNMAKGSMNDFYAGLKGRGDIRQDALMAEIYADVDYINGNYAKAKLQFGIEEEVPTQVLERIPAIGRLFKASDISFVDSAIRARRGLFKIQKKVYEAKGLELTDATLKDMGNVINAITARGRVGMFLGSKPTQLLLWAPKMMKADWDVLTAHTFGFGLETKTARIEAAKTITSVVLVTAAITAIAESMGAEVEKDPRSTDFLRIKIGNTRINTPFGRGMPQIVTLMSRIGFGLAGKEAVKSQSGTFYKLNTGEYGSRSLFDVGIDFLKNKTTPPVRAALAWLEGSDYKGDKPTISGTALGFIPISVQNFIGLKDEATTESVVGAFLDLVGVSANTYSSTDANWGESTGKELLQFKEKVGEEKFKEANDLYNKRYEEWFASVKKNPEYMDLSNDDKKRVLSSKKSKLKSEIFKEYNFKYKTEKLEKIPSL